MLLAILLEFGSAGQLGPVGDGNAPRSGIGIPYLAVLDLLLLYTLLLLSLDLLGPLRALIARVQGVATFLLSLLGLLAVVVMIFLALNLIVLMVTLLLALPFGPVAYLAVWGHFKAGAAQKVLAMAMLFKLVGVGLLLFGRPLLLKNLGFVLMIATTLGCTFLLSILVSWPPVLLVSITDAIGAIVIAILAAVWLVVFLVGAIPAMIRALRSLLPSAS
ncbi:hypothetical protein [Dankookia sp. P2]|uniref:hypothetical protein n=1 Tax=Dankookia sp. P2 TaxID=3423955 RepID=UPI003D668148